MNVFILNTGRCGSTTFIKACRHISNYTSAHESRCGKLGDDRFGYPSPHIEADNRLSWVLGRLDRHFGDGAFYVHLRRRRNATAASFVQRYSAGIMKGYRTSILMDLPEESEPMAVAADYCDTVDSNIGLFLKDKPLKMDFRLENAQEDFRIFWDRINARGHLMAALAEFNVAYNPNESLNVLERGVAKVRRMVRQSRVLKRVEQAILLPAAPAAVRNQEAMDAA